ncbi:unnamed protein product [Caenorhabditis brenneri]
MKINRFNQKFNDSDFSNRTLFCNDTENSTDLVASKLEAFALNSFLIILGVFVLCLWILFPFYVYLNKVNKERDESMPLYPITSHLYDTVKSTYITFSFLFISIILMLVTFYLNIHVAFEILHLLPMITVPTLYIITEVTQLLISLVAIRKFVIYFFPASIPKVMKVQEWMVRHLWILYAGITVKELVGVVIFFVNLWKPCDEQKSSLYYPISYVLTLTFHTASSLLYVAIAIRMRIKKSTSSKKNKPQIYMVWQAMIIMVFKLITITIALLLYLSSSTSRFYLYFTIFIMEVVSTPLIVQISYLFNNKKSLKTLILNFKFANFIRVLMNIEVKSIVGPAPSGTDNTDAIAMEPRGDTNVADETGKNSVASERDVEVEIVT